MHPKENRKKTQQTNPIRASPPYSLTVFIKGRKNFPLLKKPKAVQVNNVWQAHLP